MYLDLATTLLLFCFDRVWHDMDGGVRLHGDETGTEEQWALPAPHHVTLAAGVTQLTITCC